MVACCDATHEKGVGGQGHAMAGGSTLYGFSWGTFDDAFIDELAAYLRGNGVLEVFAGNGLLTSILRLRGVDSHSTTLFRTHDGHEDGIFGGPEVMDARDAATKYRNSHDVLLMSWPPPDEAAMQASILWGEQRPIVFVGEVTDLAAGRLGGCASDLFFELSEETSVFESYRSARSGLDRAAVRRLLPGATAEYARRLRGMRY
jgi:hypothetical protein